MATPPEPKRRRRRLYEALPDEAASEPEGPTTVPPASPPAPAPGTPRARRAPATGAGAASPEAASPASRPAAPRSEPRRPEPSPPPSPPPPPPADVLVPDRASPTVGREREAARVVQRYVYWAAGLSLVPAVGAASVIGIQLKMLRDLTRLYGIPFSEQRGRALVATLGGGLGAMAGGAPVLALALTSLFPTAWPVLVAASSTASASTYAIGRLFTQHLERGGDFHSFRAEETRATLEARAKATPAAAAPSGL